MTRPAKQAALAALKLVRSAIKSELINYTLLINTVTGETYTVLDNVEDAIAALTAEQATAGEPTRDEVMSAALIAGFSISTMHGQEVGKLMPTSDLGTLMAFYRALTPKADAGEVEQ